MPFHEPLLRLRTSQGEIVHPAVFLPTVERFNMAAEIDRRAIKLALRHLAADPALHLAINLSAPSLDDAGLPDFIRRRLPWRKSIRAAPRSKSRKPPSSRISNPPAA